MFEEIRTRLNSAFKKALSASPENRLLVTDIDREEIWNLYLANIPEEHRQSNNCNCCKSFLRQYGGIVAVKPDMSLATLWDFDDFGFPETESEYGPAIAALRRHVLSAPIAGPFLPTVSDLGTNKTPDPKAGVVWTHFYLKAPSNLVVSEGAAGPAKNRIEGNFQVLKRSLDLSMDAIDTVLDLIGQGTLYRGQTYLNQVQALKSLKQTYDRFKNHEHKRNFVWFHACGKDDSVCRLNNSAIGILLNDLSEGRDINEAVGTFTRAVDPENYQRSRSIATPKMIDQARSRIEALGLMDSVLNRRQLSETDLTVANALFVHRRQTRQTDIFSQLKEEVPVTVQSFGKLEEVTVDTFIDKVIPTARSLRVFVENSHLGNFVSLIGPVGKDQTGLFKWGNDFSWSYTGQVADSIRDRVKAKGGNVSGFFRVSLSWTNLDDLDLALQESTGEVIYYGNKASHQGGALDVDMNVSSPSKNAVENICYEHRPRPGVYTVLVNNFRRREVVDQGFQVEVEFAGQVYQFSYPNNQVDQARILMITVTQNDFKIEAGDNVLGGASAAALKEKWGIKTNQFHGVKAVTLSPNHWEKPTGLRHLFLLLENCKSDERLRPFYNEFVAEKFRADRKVFELLADRIEVQPAEDQLSGLGFSHQQSFIVEVESAFKRRLKVIV